MVRGMLGVRSVMLALVMILGVAGCATVGQDFPVAPISELQVGETTKDQVREMFGPPWRVGVENGKRTWTYGRYHYRLIGEPSTRDLVIRFDSDQVVESYSFNTTDHSH